MKVNKEIINLNVYWSELKDDQLILYGDRGNDKQYEIRIKLDEYKSTSIARDCKKYLVNKMMKFKNHIDEVTNYLKNYGQ
jgi:hypothetical protein